MTTNNSSWSDSTRAVHGGEARPGPEGSLVFPIYQSTVYATRPDTAPDDIDYIRLAIRCDLIVTTTPSKDPLLPSEAIRPGTHITAIGSDTLDKQELDPAILTRADAVVVDSREQARLRGEVAHALRHRAIQEDEVHELGDVISGKSRGRLFDGDVTVADLTGVAVQDIQIAKAVCRQLGLDLAREDAR